LKEKSNQVSNRAAMYPNCWSTEMGEENGLPQREVLSKKLRSRKGRNRKGSKGGGGGERKNIGGERDRVIRTSSKADWRTSYNIMRQSCNWRLGTEGGGGRLGASQEPRLIPRYSISREEVPMPVGRSCSSPGGMSIRRREYTGRGRGKKGTRETINL